MSDQKQLSNQARDNKAHKPHKTSGQKQPPASQRVENQTHLIPPNLLEQALQNPQAARPETILQLQRQYGNQVVSQLLAQQGPNRANSPSGSQPALGSSPVAIQARPTHKLTPTLQQTGSIQRVIKMDFKGNVGVVAAQTSKHNILYKEIRETFDKYKKISKRAEKIKNDPETYKEAITAEIELLKQLESGCNNWINAYKDKYADTDKMKDLMTLLGHVKQELPSRFAERIRVDLILDPSLARNLERQQLKIRELDSEIQEAEKERWISKEYELLQELYQACQILIEAYPSQGKTEELQKMITMMTTASSKLANPKFAAHVKSDKQLKKLNAYEYKINSHNKDNLPGLRGNKQGWRILPPEEQEEWKNRYKEKVTNLEKANLTRAERAAIASYTDANFAFINPAVSDNEEWLKANIESDKTLKFRGTKLDTSPQGIKKAIVENKKIAKLAQAGLNKLPNWQQDKRLYRGDTFSIKEGQKLKPGETKTYPHFVSTSLATTVPQGYAANKRSPERPIGIVWHITHSKNGKNIADLSAVQSELEILFPPNTTFQIDKVLDRKLDEKGMIEEVEAHEV